MNKFCKTPEGTKIQTLIFSKDAFTEKSAKGWAEKNDFKYGSVDEKDLSFRLRQHNPDDFKKDTFRTIDITDGVKAVIGCPDVEFASGGTVEFVKESDKYNKMWGRKGTRNDKQCVGGFDLKSSVGINDFYLYPLDDFDKDYYKHITLKKGERLYRYRSNATDLGKYFPLIKINVEKALVYFMADMYSDDDKNPVFETVGIKPKWISMLDSEKFADGGVVPVDKETAKQILTLLGGMNKLAMMTGAYNFVAMPNGVSFRIKNARANYIKIIHTGMDLFDLEVCRIRAEKYTVVESKEGLYDNMLKPAIEKATGMYLSLKDGGLITGEAELEKVLVGDGVTNNTTFQDLGAFSVGDTVRTKTLKDGIIKKIYSTNAGDVKVVVQIDKDKFTVDFENLIKDNKAFDNGDDINNGELQNDKVLAFLKKYPLSVLIKQDIDDNYFNAPQEAELFNNLKVAGIKEMEVVNYDNEYEVNFYADDDGDDLIYSKKVDKRSLDEWAFDNGGAVSEPKPQSSFTHDEWNVYRNEFNDSFKKEYGLVNPTDATMRYFYVSSHYPEHKIYNMAGYKGGKTWWINGVNFGRGEFESLKEAKDELYSKYRAKKAKDDFELQSISSEQSASNEISQIEKAIADDYDVEHKSITTEDLEDVLQKEKNKLLRYDNRFVKSSDGTIPHFKDIVSALQNSGWSVVSQYNTESPVDSSQEETKSDSEPIKTEPTMDEKLNSDFVMSTEKGTEGMYMGNEVKVEIIQNGLVYYDVLNIYGEKLESRNAPIEEFRKAFALFPTSIYDRAEINELVRRKKEFAFRQSERAGNTDVFLVLQDKRSEDEIFVQTKNQYLRKSQSEKDRYNIVFTTEPTFAVEETVEETVIAPVLGDIYLETRNEAWAKWVATEEVNGGTKFRVIDFSGGNLEVGNTQTISNQTFSNYINSGLWGKINGESVPANTEAINESDYSEATLKGINKLKKEIEYLQSRKTALENNEIKPHKIIGTGYKPQHARRLAFEWLDKTIAENEKELNELIVSAKQSPQEVSVPAVEEKNEITTTTESVVAEPVYSAHINRMLNYNVDGVDGLREQISVLGAELVNLESELALNIQQKKDKRDELKDRGYNNFEINTRVSDFVRVERDLEKKIKQKKNDIIEKREIADRVNIVKDKSGSIKKIDNLIAFIDANKERAKGYAQGSKERVEYYRKEEELRKYLGAFVYLYSDKGASRPNVYFLIDFYKRFGIDFLMTNEIADIKQLIFLYDDFRSSEGNRLYKEWREQNPHPAVFDSETYTEQINRMAGEKIIDFAYDLNMKSLPERKIEEAKAIEVQVEAEKETDLPDMGADAIYTTFFQTKRMESFFGDELIACWEKNKEKYDDEFVERLRGAGFSDKNIFIILFGYTSVYEIKAEKEFSLNGVLNQREGTQSDTIDIIIRNQQTGYTICAFKYAESLGILITQLFMEYKINTTPYVFNTDEQGREKMYIYKGDGIYIGRKVNPDWQEKIPVNIDMAVNGGYVGMVADSPEKLFNAIDILFNNENCYVKDLDVFVNGLGGMDIVDVVDNFDTKKADETPQPTPTPTRAEIEDAIGGLMVMAELEPENVAYQEAVDGLRLYLEMFEEESPIDIQGAEQLAEQPKSETSNELKLSDLNNPEKINGFIYRPTGEQITLGENQAFQVYYNHEYASGLPRISSIELWQKDNDGISKIQTWKGSSVGALYTDDAIQLKDGAEILVGGKADSLTLDDIAKKHDVSLDHILRQARIGKIVEREHTKNQKVALEIVKDHLYESPDYYTKLQGIESSFAEGGSVNEYYIDVQAEHKAMFEIRCLGEIRGMVINSGVPQEQGVFRYTFRNERDLDSAIAILNQLKNPDYRRDMPQNLNQLKNYLKKGTLLRISYNRNRPNRVGAVVVVGKTQTNSFWVLDGTEVPDTIDYQKAIWIEYPKSNKITFTPFGFTLYATDASVENSVKLLQYEYVIGEDAEREKNTEKSDVVLYNESIKMLQFVDTTYSLSDSVQFAMGGKLTPDAIKNGFERNFDEQSVSCFITSRSTGRTLIVHRATEDYKDTWSLVSGGVELGEAPDETIKREIQEELGVQLDFENLNYLDDTKHPNKTHYYYELFVKDEFEPVLNYENNDYMWVNMSELPKNTHPMLKKYIKSTMFALV